MERPYGEFLEQFNIALQERKRLQKRIERRARMRFVVLVLVAAAALLGPMIPLLIAL